MQTHACTHTPPSPPHTHTPCLSICMQSTYTHMHTTHTIIPPTPLPFVSQSACSLHARMHLPCTPVYRHMHTHAHTHTSRSLYSLMPISNKPKLTWTDLDAYSVQAHDFVCNVYHFQWYNLFQILNGNPLQYAATFSFCLDSCSTARERMCFY